MQDSPVGQIRWSRILNRDPTPPSDFWPPLETGSLISALHNGTAAGEVVTAGLSRREAYVMLMHGTAVSSQTDHESTSLHSLKRFLDEGIGVDAIRNSIRTSRIASMNSSHRSLAMPPPQRLMDLNEEKAGSDGKSVGTDEISLLEMLRASPACDRLSVVRKTGGQAGTVPSNCLELLFNEKHSEVASSRRRSLLAGCFKASPQLVKKMCAKSMSTIKRKSEKLYRVTKWSQPRTQRLSNYKRRSGMELYDGT